MMGIGRSHKAWRRKKRKGAHEGIPPEEAFETSDGLRLTLFSGTTSRMYLVVRGGRLCDVSAQGFGADYTSEHVTVSARDVDRRLMRDAPWAEWGHEQWRPPEPVCDGSGWRLRVRWGDIDVDAHGYMHGPEGYREALDDLEGELCRCLGIWGRFRR